MAPGQAKAAPSKAKAGPDRAKAGPVDLAGPGQALVGLAREPEAWEPGASSGLGRVVGLGR
ncbi:MAG: hypothetical protein R3F11_17230 [Verrucomicrobiales bacterium]